MNAATLGDWQQANQRYLMEQIDVLRRRIEHPDDAGVRAPTSGWELESPPAIEHVSRVFGLTVFERDVILLCAGIELDSSFAELCARARAATTRTPPTFAFALAALREPHWSALTPIGALRYWHLIDISARESLTQASLRLDERVLHYLAGIEHLDERIRATSRVLVREERMHPCEQRAAHQLAEYWLGRTDTDSAPVAQLCSHDAGAAHRAAAAACAHFGLVPHCIHARDISASTADRMLLARLCAREAALSRRLFVLDTFGVQPGSAEERAASDFAEQVGGRLLITGATPLQGFRWPARRFDLERGTLDERREAWIAALGPLSAQRLNGSVERLAGHFDLDGSAIRAVVASLPAEGAAGDIEARLWQGCREQTRGQLDELAQRIEPRASWDDLVLPDAQLALLREVAVHVRRHQRVFGEWGFASRSSRGVGTSALFSGPTGTGKTMAAEVLAGDLQLDLYRIDLSRVVSKYIGETEKNLATIFDVGERSGAILLFDEADALFGRRSEVRDSHDRYANIEVSYLLQRMEAYRGGLAILTTNLKNTLDTAFWRRLRFVVQFPFPDAEQRAEIWRRIFPSAAPVQGLDVNKLARLNIAGGSIRSIALNAAFRAAETDEAIRMTHLLWAARQEYAKADRSLSDSEVRGWV